MNKAFSYRVYVGAAHHQDRRDGVVEDRCKAAIWKTVGTAVGRALGGLLSRRHVENPLTTLDSLPRPVVVYAFEQRHHPTDGEPHYHEARMLVQDVRRRACPVCAGKKCGVCRGTGYIFVIEDRKEEQEDITL